VNETAPLDPSPEAAPHPRFEATLGGTAMCAGRGLHTGRRSSARILPAPAGHGVVFRRIVAGAAHEIPALWTNRRSRPLCTALQVGDGPLVRTVEHLLAALAAERIDNALVELDAEELPILDGSAEPWRAAIAAVGRVELDRPRAYLRVLKRVDYVSGPHNQRIEPAPSFQISTVITLSHFGRLRWEGAVTPETFARELAASRSFGRFKWAFPSKLISLFRREPVLRGADLKNTAALWGKTAIGGLRFPDEPVRHRALDLIGDLSLAGAPLIGRVFAARPGHEHNFGLLAALMADRSAWELVVFDVDGAARRVEAA
jgi:UDP-3-O-[3-hydroxymyristoyl] N-acetylglucosamine deacetylase